MDPISLKSGQHPDGRARENTKKAGRPHQELLEKIMELVSSSLQLDDLDHVV